MLSNPTPIAQWAFDTHAHQIHAVDHQGRVLMAITASPLFGTQLAAAFGGPGRSAAAFGLSPSTSPWSGPRALRG